MGKCLSLFLLLLAFYFEEQLGSVNHSALSFTKGGNIRIGSCDFEQVLFNSSIASEWSCEDATTYTWRHDFDGVLRSIGLRPADHERLLASAGFCPHKRCQLDNASTSGASEFCPPGLCYTKIENGRPSFGACCFTKGIFESQQLLGFYDRSQPTPKPIYKRNRIVLGGDPSDTSAESFINANEIAPGLIAAQCPMTSYPKDFANTIEDMKRLLIEQDVGLWVQLSPASHDGELLTPKEDGSTPSFCEVFPLKYLNPSLSSANGGTNVHQKGVSQFSFVQNNNLGFFNMSYTLTAFVRRSKGGDESNTKLSSGASSATIVDSVFDPMIIINKLQREGQVQELATFREQFASDLEGCEFDAEGGNCEMQLDQSVNGNQHSRPNSDTNVSSSSWELKTVTVEHIWFYRWEDFGVPSRAFFGAMNTIADRTVSVMERQRQSAVITCFSGRGRTGTFAALVLAKRRFASLLAGPTASPPSNPEHHGIVQQERKEEELKEEEEGINKNKKKRTPLSAHAALPLLSGVAGVKARSPLEGEGDVVSAVVDIIVDLRRSRDGLVETPQQLKFILDVMAFSSLDMS